MQQKDLLKLVGKWLDDLGIAYMLTGAWSVIYHGRIRTSHDLDFVVEMRLEQVPKLITVLSKSGNEFLFQKSAIDEAVEKKGMFMVSYLPTNDKIDFWLLTNSDFDRARFNRRIKVTAWGQEIYVTSPEDTILQKFNWLSKSKIEKHLVDAAFIWQLQKKLDKRYIKDWAAKLGVSEYLLDLDKVNLEDYY